jgi:AIG2-like family
MIYFAYGTDLNPSRMMQNAPGYKSLGIARIRDWWIDFPRYSLAERSATMSIVSQPGAVVWGALYEVPDWDVPILDGIFGFNPDGSPNLNEHARREIEVERPNRPHPTVANTYVASPQGPTKHPTPAYMTVILDGARYHGLPKAYIGALQAVRTANG